MKFIRLYKTEEIETTLEEAEQNRKEEIDPITLHNILKDNCIEVLENRIGELNGRNRELESVLDDATETVEKVVDLEEENKFLKSKLSKIERTYLNLMVYSSFTGIKE